jgi:hypothetical protein
MPSNSIKPWGIPVALKCIIYAMQNSPMWDTPAQAQAHESDLAPVKYPTGVT